MQENLSFFINQTPFTEHPNAPLAPARPATTRTATSDKCY